MLSCGSLGLRTYERLVSDTRCCETPNLVGTRPNRNGRYEEPVTVGRDRQFFNPSGGMRLAKCRTL